MGETSQLPALTLGAITVLCLAACGQNEVLSQSLPCVDDSDCPAAESCRVNRCVPHGTVVQDDTCTSEDQCAEGLICYGFQCVPGCSDVYRLDDCDAGLFCKPADHTFVLDDEGRRSMVGTCEPSECDPLASSNACPAGESCVRITNSTGACVTSCSYGFAGPMYHDDCAPRDGIEHSCHPLGLEFTPVCLPAGDSAALRAGVAGCSTIASPCYEGSICVNVVCRQMCHPSQTSPCPPGQRCITLAERADVSYCKAE